MNEKLKHILKAITPPILLSIYRKAFNNVPVLSSPVINQNIIFKGIYSSWQQASANCIGYQAEDIVSRVLEATKKVRNGEAVFERDSVLFTEIEYAWPVLSGLLLAAAKSSGNLNVLDFGGSLGSSYFQNRKFLTHLNSVHWGVIEQPQYTKAGIEEIQTDQLSFHLSITDYLIKNTPNVVLLSSVLQYLPEPYAVLKEVLATNPEVIILDRTCYQTNSTCDELYIQIVPSSIYSASYPCWFLAEKKLLDLMNEYGYSLIEDFLSLDKLDNRATWKGHIFSRNLNG